MYQYFPRPPPSSGESARSNLPGASLVTFKELKLSYCIGEIILITIYTHYGNLV